MTMGFLEGYTESVGDELAELAGFLQTRLTAVALPEQDVQTALNSASGTAGEAAIVLAVDCTWNGSLTVACTDTTGVVVTKFIRLDSDGQLFEVASFVANTSITITNPGGLTIPSGTGRTSQLVPTVVTLGSGTFDAAVLAGQRFRLTSGGNIGDSALINTVDSGTQLTLRAAISVPPASFTSESWEVVIDPETTINVESTLDWESSGFFYLDGVKYRYSSKTVTTLDELEYYDGAFYQSGVKQQHDPLAVVSDFTGFFSALDEYKRSFFVETAVGKDLDVVGGNIGVPRPSELGDDDLYRALIQAIAYAPRGTIFALELALDALLGETVVQESGDDFATIVDTLVTINGTLDASIEKGYRFRLKSEDDYLNETVLIEERISGTQLRLQSDRFGSLSGKKWEITKKNWAIFEDLTDFASLHHPCRIYVTKNTDADTDPNGKAYIERAEWAPLTGAGAITIVTDYLKVFGMRLKDEGYDFWEVASGSAAASADGGTTITGPASEFPADIKKGDIFQLTNSVYAGARAVVVSRDSDTQLTLGHVDGESALTATDDGSLGFNFSGASWIVLRDKSNVRFYKPSTEVVVEYPGDAGTTLWAFDGGGGGVEGTDVTVTSSASRGPFLELADNLGELVYKRTARITQESHVEFEILWDHDNNLNANTLQMGICISDGVRAILVGQRKAGNPFGFCNEAGTFIGTTGTWTVSDPGFHTFHIKKSGTKDVELWAEYTNASGQGDGLRLIDKLPYSSFPTIAAWQGAANYTAGAREIAYGNMQSGAGHIIYIKHVDWRITNTKDYWNTSIPNGASNVDELSDNDTAALHLSGDVGKLIRVLDFAAVNASNGNARGEWEVAAFTDANTIDVIGPTQNNGGFTLQNTAHLVVRDMPDAFRWPDHLGHSVEILSGPNAGVFPILNIIDPETGANIADILGEMEALASTWTDASKILAQFESNIVELDTVGGAPSLPSFTVSSDEVQWRLIPNFPNDSGPVKYEIVETGTDGGGGSLTTRSNTPFATGTVMAVERSQVLTGQLRDAKDRNDDDGVGGYEMYPFYLFDALGFVRRVVDYLTVSGVIPGFEVFTIDDAGPHILE